MRQFIRFLAVTFGIFILLAAGGLVYLYIRETPPKESKLVAQFYQRRASYERLREMLQADTNTLSVRDDGIETTTSDPLPVVPPAGGMPVARYHEYLALLKRVDSPVIMRWERSNPTDVDIAMWGAGFAGDTRHIDVVWLNHEPSNQIGNLDDFYKAPKPRTPVLRHIEGNWYLWADW